MAAPLSGFAQARPFAPHQQAQKPRIAPRRVVCKADANEQQHQFGAGLSGGLALLVSAPRAWAEGLELPADLTYPGLNVPELPSLPTESAGIADFISDYPLLLPATIGLLIGPLIISKLNTGSSKVQSISAARALDALNTEDPVVFVDIRNKESVKQYGDPSLSSVKKSIVRVPFSKTVKGEYVLDETFVQKFSKLRALTEETTVILLDSFGKESPQAGQQVSGSVAKVLYIQDGAEGPRGWKAAELPWKEPGRGFFDLSALKDLGSNIDSFAEDFKSTPTAGKAVLGLGALVGGALLFFQEIDTALEVAGIFAAGQFALRRLLFAEDRQATQKQIKQLVDEKIAVKDVPEDLRKLADKVLEAESAAEKKVTGKVEKEAKALKKEVVGSAKELKREVVGAATDAKAELQGAAKGVSANVDAAADKATKEAGGAVNAAKDTVDLNGAGAPTAVAAAGPKAEARRWINNWRSKNN